MGKPHRQFEADPAADIVTGAAVRTRYVNVAETLLGAILASPHEAAARLAEIDPVFWSDSEHYPAAKSLFVFLEKRQDVSVRAVAVASGANEDVLYSILAKNASVGFDVALDMFLPIYQFYVEWVAQTRALMHVEKDGGTAEEVQAVAQMIREKKRQYIDLPKNDFEALDAWARVKLQGYEYDYICKPHISALQTNNLLFSFEPGCMYVVAARPNMGKTHFVCGLIKSFEDAGARGLFFSADMDRLNVQKRLVGMVSGQNPRSDWSMAREAETMAITEAITFVRGMKCRIIDNIVDVSRVQAICSAEMYREKLDYLIFDYLQLFRVEGTKDRYSTVTAASIAVKQLSKTLCIPVIVLSQLSRDNEKRGGSKRPALSDLRDSGAIEENATWVAFLHRPEYYGAEMEDGAPSAGLGEIIVAKSQTGETGVCLASFNGVSGWSDILEPTQPQKMQFVDFSTARPKNYEDVPF